MPSIHFSNTFFEAMSKIIEKVYVKEGEEIPEMWKEVFVTPEYDKKRRFFTQHSIVPLGLLSSVEEGQVPTSDYASPGLTMSFFFQDFGLEYVITKTAEREDPKAIFELMPKMLRRSVSETMEYLFWNNLNLSFLSAANGGYNVDDGLPLISSVHPCTGSPSILQSNSLGATALTVESLQAVLTAFSLIKNDRGILSKYMPKMIIYPPGYHQQVTEILKTDLYPETNANKINVVSDKYRDSQLTRLEVPYLNPAQGPGPYPWWVTTAKGSLERAHSMFAVVKENESWTHIDQRTRNLHHVARIRVSWGVTSWRGVMGSLGA